jgi:allantoicase
MSVTEPALFANLVDLASAAFGGRAVFATDDFFASVSRLVEPAEPEFDPARYTERGKWMDGWESRRKRGSGHDYAVVELGTAGSVLGFDVDTRHFIGNHPPFASIDGARAPAGATADEVSTFNWRPLLSEVPLRPGTRNVFGALAQAPVNYVRLRIFPDGGVARLRVFGDVEPLAAAPEHDDESRTHVPRELVDLAALKSGGKVLACSDARFGAMNQLILPGRARTMGEGWETRRGRPPDHRHDWLILKLAARGTPVVVEVDTNHYKGNFPERCSLEGLDAVSSTATELFASDAWREFLPATPLRASSRHFLVHELAVSAPLSHVRLKIFPDGGISRLRIWGKPHV